MSRPVGFEPTRSLKHQIHGLPAGSRKASKRIDEDVARGLCALPLSYSHHVGKGDWWDSNPRRRGPKPVLRTGSQSVFRVSQPQRGVVETMRLAAHLMRVM